MLMLADANNGVISMSYTQHYHSKLKRAEKSVSETLTVQRSSVCRRDSTRTVKLDFG